MKLYDLDAENAVIGACFYCNELIEKINPDLFYDPNNRVIAEVMVKMQSQMKPVDAVTIHTLLNDKEGLIAHRLSQLLESVPTSANFDYYNQIVKERYKLRNLKTDIMAVLDTIDNNGNYQDVKALSESILNKQILENENVKIKPLNAIVSEFFDQYNKIVQNGGKTIGIASGFEDLDAFTGGLVGGELIIIGARSSMGKTLFALNIAQNVAKNHNVLFCSIEMTAIELLVRMIARELSYNIQDIRNALLTSGQIDKMVAETAKIVSLNLHINDNGYILIEDILSQARELKRKKDIKLLVVDHIGLVFTRERFERRDLQIGYITRRLKELAKELDITVIGVAQLNRENKDRKEKTPILTDLRDSGNIEQDANVVILLHREYYYTKNEADKNKAKIIIAKNRNGEVTEFDIGFYGWRGCFETIRSHSQAVESEGKPFIKNSFDNF